MSHVALRDATAGDADVVCDLIRRLAAFEELGELCVVTADDIARELSSPEAAARVLLAERDGEIAGMALYVRTFSTFLGRRGIWLEDLFVVEEHRRRGVAGALLAELARRTPGRLEWEVLDWNEGAIALYERMGAEPQSGWTKYRVLGEDR